MIVNDHKTGSYLKLGVGRIFKKKKNNNNNW